MWFLVQVVKGSKHFESESQVGNHVLISDTTDMVISGRSLGVDGYRFEARKGNESFAISDFPGVQTCWLTRHEVQGAGSANWSARGHHGIVMRVRPNPSINGTRSGLRPARARYVKR
jgi:hypothetical protein